MDSSGLPSGDERLDGWKDIAHHLNRTTRTVQRWHTEFGMPVYRVLGKKSSVFAYTRELDTWIRSERHGTQATVAQPPAVTEDRIWTSASMSEVGADQSTEGSQGRPRPSRANSIDKANALWRVLSYRNSSTLTRSFRQIIEVEPANAPALAGLAHALMMQGILGELRLPEAYNSAFAAVEFALEIDPDLADARCAEAWLNVLRDRKWDAAREKFERMDEDAGIFLQMLVGRALLEIAAGDIEEASAVLHRASTACPLSTTWDGLYCWAHYLGEQYARAKDHIAQTHLSSKTGRLLLSAEALISLQTEEPQTAAEHIQKLLKQDPKNLLLHAAHGCSLAKSGRTAETRQVLDFLQGRHLPTMRVPHYGMAMVRMGLGEHQKAVRELELSYALGSLWSLGFHSDPILAPLRGEPMFRAFLSRSYPASSRLHFPECA